VSLPLSVHGWQLQCGEITPEQVVDLREPEAFARAHLAGALNIPYRLLQVDGPAQLSREKTVLVVDPGGARAAEMATWLRARGFDAAYLEGGYAAWTGPLERPRRSRRHEP
jgi:rhodanese-related sulfurtransferase